MKTRPLIIALTLFIGLFMACRDQKKVDKKPETEVVSETNPSTTEDTIDEAEKRRLDSIRQVKEHGHVH